MPQQHVQIPRLTLITDSSRFSGETFFHSVEQALQGGVEAVLVREKNMTSAKLLALASRLRAMTCAHQARLIIHSQADICNAVNADGVHLASNAINAIPALRQWLEQGSEASAQQPNKSVSVSCHNAVELDRAQQLGADYAMLSPVFPTASHPGAPYLGLDTFQALADATALPIIALGGISLENCTALQGKRLAVIGALLESHQPKQAAQQLCNTAIIA